MIRPPLLTLAAAALVLAGCGANTTSAGAPSTPTPTSTRAAATPATSAAPSAQRPSDPRCTPASTTLVNQVSVGLKDQTLSLTHGTVIVDGALQFFGATTVRADGTVANRSDVWVIQNGTVYAATGGARDTGSYPSAGAALKIPAGDSRVQAVDSCVVNLTR
ncbi:MULTISPECIES: hypothetical protein [Rhodococcus]|uniref:hypothetical protein n=1 Tax=Rhodococcus TaxID=1827 RepID=UPI0015E0CA36|nr:MULTISPECIES: hypothetical protein [Rhodococcus]WKX01789.1 hypothetical protein Q3O43_27830 [Rhodococcus aetherivorans]